MNDIIYSNSTRNYLKDTMYCNNTSNCYCKLLCRSIHVQIDFTSQNFYGNQYTIIIHNQSILSQKNGTDCDSSVVAHNFDCPHMYMYKFPCL